MALNIQIANEPIKLNIEESNIKLSNSNNPDINLIDTVEEIKVQIEETTEKIIIENDNINLNVSTEGARGEQGVNGKNIEMQNSGTYIQWKLVGDVEWNNLIALSDLKN